jgi:ATP/maltotriose-dependent transcriptional regulator MalT
MADTTHEAALGAGHDWPAEYAALTTTEAERPLTPEELERMSMAAFVLGHDPEVSAYRERAHEAYLAQGRIAEAVRAAFWLGFHLQNRGEHARAAGWMGRVRRLVPPGDEDLTALMTQTEAAALMLSGEFAPALPLFQDALAVAQRTGNRDAIVLGAMGSGRCLEMTGHPAEALAALDEAMVLVTGGNVIPEVAGMAYCAVIDLCMRRYDMRRAQEWTQALTGWCDEQAGLVPFRGVCLVHRAEILQLRGAWTEAAGAAEDACRRLAGFRQGALGAAYYRMAELERQRGRFAAAEQAYQQAAAAGAEVQPGLARLRAAQGNRDAAIAGLERALAEDPDAQARPAMLAARVELAIEAGDLDTARATAQELTGLAAGQDATYLRGLAAYAEGAVLLACDDPRSAIPALRRAWSSWQALEAPYEAARSRVLVAKACRALGDTDAEQMELDGARQVFERLGAVTDLAALDGPAEQGHPLSPRELEVLRLLATGATNRAVADQLFLSERTVARHVSNIFGKLGVNSRSAATAYAYEHRLAGPPT